MDAEAGQYAQREWEFARREGYGSPYAEPKLVVTPLWELRLIRKPPEPFPHTGRRAMCARCGANMPSTALLAFYPERIEERPKEECDLYIHQCEEEMT